MYHCQSVCHVWFVKRPDYTGVNVNLLCFICNNQMATFLLIQPLVPFHVQGKEDCFTQISSCIQCPASYFLHRATLRGDLLFYSLCSLHCDEVIATLSCCVTGCRGNLCQMVRMYYFWQAGESICQPHMWLLCSSNSLFPLESLCFLCWDVQGDTMEVYWRACGADSIHEVPRPVPALPVNILLCK